MTGQDSGSASGLPPIPDVFGDPRPPAVRGTASRSARIEHLDPRAPADRRSALGPGDEPALEAADHGLRYFLDAAVSGGIGLSLIVAVLTTLVDLVGGGPVDGPGWVVLAVAFVLGAVGGLMGGDGPATVVAGARWLATPGSGPVRLYELVSVRSIIGDHYTDVLVLTDRSATVTCSMSLLHSNPRLWELVRNGVRHSVAGGATVSPDTDAQRTALGIDATTGTP